RPEVSPRAGPPQPWLPQGRGRATPRLVESVRPNAPDMPRPSPADMRDVAALITRDHDAIRQVFVELTRDTPTPGVRRNLVQHLLTEITAHGDAEQEVVYPEIGAELGEDVARDVRSQHDEIERLIARVLAEKDDDRR